MFDHSEYFPSPLKHGFVAVHSRHTLHWEESLMCPPFGGVSPIPALTSIDTTATEGGLHLDLSFIFKYMHFICIIPKGTSTYVNIKLMPSLTANKQTNKINTHWWNKNIYRND